MLNIGKARLFFSSVERELSGNCGDIATREMPPRFYFWQAAQLDVSVLRYLYRRLSIWHLSNETSSLPPIKGEALKYA
jgi:hypothetical protein